MSRRRRRRAAAVVIAAATVLAGGCGQPARLDGEAVEERIRGEIEHAHPVEVSNVDCGDELEVGAGRSFSCSVAIEPDAELSVDVRQVDGAGRLEVVPEEAVIVADEVEADIVEVLADRFERDDATVTCAGPEVRVERPDATFECEARDGDETRTVVVRVRDERGGLTYTLS